MEKNKILCLDNFYVRYANLSFDKFEKVANQNNYTLFNEFYNNTFKQDILLTSSSLYATLSKGCKDDNICSLLKYIIRSSTRCTPYSSLSGVGLGRFTNKNNYNIDIPKLYFRVDNEWLLPILPKLEQEIRNDIYVVKNKDIEENDKKIVNHWVTHYYLETNKNTNEVIINNTSVVKKVLELTQSYIKKEDLINNLLEIYGSERLSDISKLLDQLQKYEILVSNLRFCPLINDPLKEIIKTGEKFNYHSPLLEKLGKFYYDLCNLNIDFSIPKYERLINEMKDVYNCKNIIRVDSYYESVLDINIEEKKKLEDYANFINSFSNDEDKYINHCKSFIDKFGNVRVPVKYAFDKYKGIGLPTKIFRNEEISDNGKRLIHYLNENIKSGSVIDLSNFMVEDKNKEKYRTNMELAFYPILNGTELNYITSPFCASNNLFESFGRFNYIFRENNSKFFNKEDIDYVEITYIPKNSRVQNVINCTTDCNYYLEYTTNTNILGKTRLTLDDISVSSNGNEFFYYNNITGKQIAFNANNKALRDFMPPILNFILDSSQRKIKNNLYFFNLINRWLEGFDILPEIRYKNVVVSPQKWKLDNNKINLTKKQSYEIFCTKLDEKIKTDQLPSKVFFEYMDNRLLLDLNNDLHKKILFQQIKSSPKGILVKNYFTDNDLIVINDSGEKHVSELIFQFAGDNTNYTIHETLSFSKESNRTLFPFNKWTYFNIYVKDYFQDEFLTNYLMPFLLHEKTYSFIREYFYIRYIDELPHIRLRVKSSYINKFMVHFNEFILKCKDMGYVEKYSINVYERETERYGYGNIERFEKMFCENTYFSLELLYLLTKKRIDYTKESLYIMTVLYILFNLHQDVSQVLSMYKTINFNKREYQKKYKFIENIMYPDENFIKLRKSSLGTKLYSILENSNNQVLEYFNCENYDNDQLISYFHMFFNRLLGIDRRKENELNCYVERIFYGITSRQKYSKTK